MSASHELTNAGVSGRSLESRRSQAHDASYAVYAHTVGRLRERFASIVGWATIGAIAYGVAMDALLFVAHAAPQISVPGTQVAYLWSAGKFASAWQGMVATLPFLTPLDAGLSVLIVAFAARLGMTLIETRSPMVVGVTRIRRRRVVRQAKRLADIVSLPFGSGGLARNTHPRPEMGVSLEHTLSNRKWAHELGHVIDYYISDSGVLDSHTRHPGYQQLLTNARRLYPGQINNEEIFACGIHMYMKHPHVFKALYPSGARLIREIVNSSRMGKYFQFV